MVKSRNSWKQTSLLYYGLLITAVLIPAQSVITHQISAAELPVVQNVDLQPFAAATNRLIEALEFVGAPLAENDKMLITAAIKSNDANAATQIQKVLDRYCLAGVTISPESRVKVTEGAAKKELVEQGWRTFLVKVDNKAGITPQLVVQSPNAAPQFKRAQNKSRPENNISSADIEQRFLDIYLYDKRPLRPRLSGLNVEYQVVQLFSRDKGKREAKISFHVGQGTQDIGFRNTTSILFDCVPAVQVVLDVLDHDGKPTMAAFVIRDRWGRVYPNPARRLAPDFFFHNQVYRAQGETVALPPGEYDVSVSRGPEYHVQTSKIKVAANQTTQTESFRLQRWIHPALQNWFSGDHHVHSAGCLHYDDPTQGVLPEDMMRHVLGEDLNVGCVLTWGPCWYYQKQFFEGGVSPLSAPTNLLRYDVEVSGFPSSHAGHLCLLRLKEDDYPGTTEIEEWPSWTLPVLKWGKEQDGVVGYSHSGWGLALPDHLPNGTRGFYDGRQRGNTPPDWKGKPAYQLPDYAMPRFDGIGANEYIVAVTHDLCDFISAVDTPSIWELNIWYHTLNCGFRTRISGETDFPCIYGDRVGLGRIYVKLDDSEPLDFDNWMTGLKHGRSYCGDGMSHILDFKVNDVGVGQVDKSGNVSELKLAKAQNVKVTCDVAALLKETPDAATEAIRNSRLDVKPYWHIERSRIGDTRTVPVELIVNGEVVATRNIQADGKSQTLDFEIPLESSSWVAMRIFPSAHTNPVFVEVAGEPVRSNLESAKWCRKAVDVCWNSKRGQIRADDLKAASDAYGHARKVFDEIIASFNKK